MIFKCWSQSIFTWWSKGGSGGLSQGYFLDLKDCVLVNFLSALTVVINLLKLYQVVWLQLAGLQEKGGFSFKR